jgi:hypothetical protein
MQTQVGMIFAFEADVHSINSKPSCLRRFASRFPETEGFAYRHYFDRVALVHHSQGLPDTLTMVLCGTWLAPSIAGG